MPLQNHFRLNFGTKMGSKFFENNFKTGLRTWSLTKISENTAQEGSQDALEGFHEAPNLAHRRFRGFFFRSRNVKLQLAIRSVPLTGSTVESPKLSKTLFDTDIDNL